MELDLVTRVRLHVLERTIDSAQVPSAARVAAQLGLPPAEVIDAYRQLAEGHVYVLEPGDPTRLRMANPFSGVPTSYTVETNGRSYYGNCVWDSLGIIGLLGHDGTVTTSCPDCNESLELRIADGHLVNPTGVVHFSVPARQWWDDIIYT